MAPLLLIAMAIAGMVFGQEAVRDEIAKQLSGLLGAHTAKILDEMVQAAAKPKSCVRATRSVSSHFSSARRACSCSSKTR